MTRNFSAFLAAVAFAVAPLALHAQLVFQLQQVQLQQDPTQDAASTTPEAATSQSSNEQLSVTSQSEVGDQGVSSQWETTMPSTSDITVINVKPSKLDSKADKAKAAAAAQIKKKMMPQVKPKSAPVGTPGGTAGKGQNQPSNWETEFMVDRQDRQVDRATPKN